MKRNFFLLRYVSSWWKTSPQFIVHKIKRRLRGMDYDYSLNGVLADAKHMSAVHLIDRWERYWRVIENQTRSPLRKEFQFAGKIVMEVGCGPLLGWGPLAIYCGAKQFYYSDTSIDVSVYQSPIMAEQYFEPLYKELVANYGRRMSYETFYRLVITNSIPAEKADSGSVDCVLSNSVLEHIPTHDIADVLKKVFSLMKRGAHFFYAVDFGSHGIGGKGFGSLYRSPRDTAYKWINSLRKSEIECVLIESGFTLKESIVYQFETLPPTIHPSWSMYSPSDLSARCVFFIGRKKA